MSKLQKQALESAQSIDSRGVGTWAPLTPAVSAFFVKTKLVLDRRHGIVHAQWSAQPGEKQFGWRPGRRHCGGRARVTPDTTRADFTDLVEQASQLILGWPDLHAAASHARTVAPAPGDPG